MLQKCKKGQKGAFFNYLKVKKKNGQFTFFMLKHQ